MEAPKGLFTVLAEWWNQRQAYYRSTRVERKTSIFAHLLPTPGNVIFTFLAIIGLLWAQNAGAIQLVSPSASSTGTIAYQGRLASAGGSPLTQTIGMEFRLYNAATGGAPLWTEQWTGSNSVQVSDGLFNVMLGSLTPIPQSVIAANSNLFLGITIGTDSEMSPRVQLGSVPFAVQALTVPDGSITKAKLAADISLVPPDGSITTAKLANGAVTANKVAPGQFLGLVSGNKNYKVQFGSVTIVGSVPQAGTGMYYGGADITFPVAFSSTPHISFGSVESSGNAVSVTARSVSASGASLQVWTVAGGASVVVHWMAIGE